MTRGLTRPPPLSTALPTTAINSARFRRDGRCESSQQNMASRNDSLHNHAAKGPSFAAWGAERFMRPESYAFFASAEHSESVDWSSCCRRNGDGNESQFDARKSGFPVSVNCHSDIPAWDLRRICHSFWTQERGRVYRLNSHSYASHRGLVYRLLASCFFQRIAVPHMGHTLQVVAKH